MKNKDTVESMYCQYCVSNIPIDSNFCPTCGMEQKRVPKFLSTTRQEKGFKEFLLKNRDLIRLTLFFISLGIFIFGLLIGTQTQFSNEEATIILQEFEDIFDTDVSALFIAQNNIALCMLFFIPIFGTPFMGFVSYNTGLLLSAFATTQSITVIDLFLSTLLFPITWMELIAYSLASTQGIMLLYGVYTRRLRDEGKNLIKVSLICLLLLGLGAVIESILITQLS